MNDNKGQTIFLSVIGIATLLVAIIGATFAYFTTTMGGTPANVGVTTGTIGSAEFTAQGIEVTEENDSVSKILPGWTSGNKTVTATLGNSDYDVNYTCKLVITKNELENMYLTVSGEGAATENNNKKLAKVADGDDALEIKISGGTLAKGTGDSKTMNYALTFAETGTDQTTAESGKSIVATVKCGLDDANVYYNDSGIHYGEANKPSANIPGTTPENNG